jgi:hypothetical protein
LSGKADYENRSKKRTQDFSRNHKMPFKKLMWFMLSLARESSRNAPERLFPKIKEAAHLTRQKVKWEAFRELFQASEEGSYNETNKESPEQAPGYLRFLLEIFAYVGEQIPHTPSFLRQAAGY